MICFSDDKKRASLAKTAQAQTNGSTTNSSQQYDPIELERRFEE